MKLAGELEWGVRTVPLLLLMLAVLGCQAEVHVSQGSDEPLAPKLSTAADVQFKLVDNQIGESSGVAQSLVDPNRFYTHNDSGDTARFFAFDTTGKSLGTFNVTNAKATDWEDMSAAKIDGKPYLFFGDIGDNKSKRMNITVYRVPEPTGAGGDVKADAAYTLTYPDGAHNAETLMVHPKTGNLYVVTKSDTGDSKVYELPAPRQAGNYTLKQIGSLVVSAPIKAGQLVTSGDISPDGSYVILRTYLAAFEYKVGSDFDNWMKEKPRAVAVAPLMQAEAIAYTADGKSLIETSEGKPCPVVLSAIRR